MSHFSKIRTNISNKAILVKTLNQMQFNFECLGSQDVHLNNLMVNDDIIVHDYTKSKNHLFTFIWNGNQYNLVVDLELWNLDMSFEYFVDLLSQNYAYNIILDQGLTSGFSKIGEHVLSDGSIKLTLKRWSNNNFS
uniref:Uncharacterized protein ycf35 n=1 Tax=Chondria sp. (in: red algae) TaxID=1982705 RepID=A0A1Z1MCJ4_9FLOR|nr:hypothetical protein [Chondria sp. (in: red algae)]